MTDSRLISFTCPRCGGALSQVNERYQCQCCDRIWENKTVSSYDQIFDVIADALSEEKKKKLANLKSRLYEETCKKFISDQEVAEICHEILNISKEDIYARFYLSTCKEDEALIQFLLTLDLQKYAEEIPDFLEYLIPGLRPRWILPISNLINNFYIGERSREYDKQRDLFEVQASKVENGIFDPKIPRKVFVAYSGKDMNQVTELVDILEDNGFSCFLAARNLQHGSGAVEKYYTHIHTAIENCQALVFVSSKHSRHASCDAYEFELPYIAKNHPKMFRVEYLIDDYTGKKAIEAYFQRFFGETDYCRSPEKVVLRLVDLFSSSHFEEKKEDREEMKRRAIEEYLQQQAAKQKEEEIRRLAIEEYIKQQNAKAEAEEKQKAEQEAKRQEEQRRAEEAKRQEEQRKAEEAKRQEEQHKAEEAQKIKEALLSDFEYEGTILKKYIGKKTEVIIPEYFTEIGESAFEECTDLTSVIIPDSITAVGEYAFFNCHNLTNISIPSSVVTIGDGVFENCIKLETVEIPSAITAISAYLFCGCSNLRSFSISNTITEIGENAFDACDKLETITIPNSVSLIGEEAFLNCKNLTDIYCKNDPAYIESHWDSNWNRGCSAAIHYPEAELIEQDTVPEQREQEVETESPKTKLAETPLREFKYSGKKLTKYIGKAAEIVIPDYFTSIGSFAFAKHKTLRSVVIPESVTSIGAFAFSECKNLVYVDMANSVTSIGHYAFDHCINLNNINLSNQLSVIQRNAFWSCNSLKSIRIPNSVTSIEKEAFLNCKNLETIDCENDQAYIENHWDPNWHDRCSAVIHYRSQKPEMAAVPVPDSKSNPDAAPLSDFEYGGTVLKKYIGKEAHVVIPECFQSIAAHAFSKNLFIEELIVPNTITSIGEGAFEHCVLLKQITLPNTLSSINEQVFAGCTSLTTIQIPNSVTVIGQMAFCLCEHLKTVTIPNSVTSIENAAFAKCSELETIKIPKSVISIGLMAFANCKSLKNIKLPNSITSIQASAFLNCVSLQNINLPMSLTEIGDNAFEGCEHLKCIFIPVSVTSLGKEVFHLCGRLEKIYCEGSEDYIRKKCKWAFRWKKGCKAEVHYHAKS